MTRALSFLVGFSAALATLRTPAQPGIALAVEEADAISLVGWGPASAILWALLRPIGRAGAHGLRPGVRRR